MCLGLLESDYMVWSDCLAKPSYYHQSIDFTDYGNIPERRGHIVYPHRLVDEKRDLSVEGCHLFIRNVLVIVNFLSYK